jgi:hypothetical protein
MFEANRRIFLQLRACVLAAALLAATNSLASAADQAITLKLGAASTLIVARPFKTVLIGDPSFSSHSISESPTSFSWTNKVSRSPMSGSWFAQARPPLITKTVPTASKPTYRKSRRPNRTDHVGY